jgi:DNA-binding transcriptional LysR family regulator
MQLDLNLLTAFDALLEERSVSGAAERLHLSAPAVSRTLARLRRVTGDQILVRTGRTMTATPYAIAVHEEVHRLVQQAEAILEPERELDLTTLKRTFTLECHDAIAAAAGLGFVARAASEAPGVSLRLLAEAPTDTQDLRHGDVDLKIGADEPQLPEIRFETIGHDRLVVVMRRGHPLAGRRLTLELFAGERHLIVSRRGRLQDPVDTELAKRGLARRVVAAAPTSTAALYFVARSDLLVAAPERVCAQMIDVLDLRTVHHPLDLEQIPVNLVWHQRYETDHAHTWLREIVRSTLTDILAGSASCDTTAGAATASSATRSTATAPGP